MLVGEAGLRGGGVVGGHRGGRGEERSGPYPSASGQLLDQGMTRPLGRPGSLLQGVMLRVDIGSGTFPCIGLHFFRGFKAADASGDIREVWVSLRSRHAWWLHQISIFVGLPSSLWAPQGRAYSRGSQAWVVSPTDRGHLHGWAAENIVIISTLSVTSALSIALPPSSMTTPLSSH